MQKRLSERRGLVFVLRVGGATSPDEQYNCCYDEVKRILDGKRRRPVPINTQKARQQASCMRLPPDLPAPSFFFFLLSAAAIHLFFFFPSFDGNKTFFLAADRRRRLYSAEVDEGMQAMGNRKKKKKKGIDP